MELFYWIGAESYLPSVAQPSGFLTSKGAAPRHLRAEAPNSSAAKLRRRHHRQRRSRNGRNNPGMVPSPRLPGLGLGPCRSCKMGPG